MKGKLLVLSGKNSTFVQRLSDKHKAMGKVSMGSVSESRESKRVKDPDVKTCNCFKHNGHVEADFRVKLRAEGS